MLDLNAVIALAAKHANNGAAMQSSAKLCLSDAVHLRDRQAKPSDAAYARERALKSLAYSVGMFHADYRAAQVSA